MGSIVSLDELRLKAGVTGSGQDAALELAIEQAEAEFEGGIGQKLLQTDYTERMMGNRGAYVQLRYYPVIDLASVTIEGEGAINVANPAEVRLSYGTSGLAFVTLVNGRRFSPARWAQVPNVTIVYGAGYQNQQEVKDALGDSWSEVLEHAYAIYKGNEIRASMKTSESYMGQSYTYAPAIDQAEERQFRRAIEKHRRRPISTMANISQGWAYR